MSKQYEVELDSKFIENFYTLAELTEPEQVTLEDLHNVLDKIKNRITDLTSASSTTESKQESSTDSTEQTFSNPESKNFLVVDDLGIITYQLNILLSKLGFEVTICKEINEAIKQFKTQDYGYAIIDLFIPTEREGFILLDEIKKLSLLCNLNTKIIVLTATSKSEYREACKNHGADFYIEKAMGWQNELVTLLKNCKENKPIKE